MANYLDSPIFGVAITIIVFNLSKNLNKKFNTPIMNPIIISVIIIIGFLTFFQVDYPIYNRGGSIITFFLGPATVVLGVPLYKQRKLLKENFLPIMMGILIGSISGLISMILLSKLFQLDDLIMYSILPKSTTSAIAMDISKSIGGNPSLTIGFVMFTGVLGYIISPSLLKVFKIDNKIAKGVSMGTAAHVIGTVKALELGEVEGAMSSLAIGVAGLMTVVLIPVLLIIFGSI